MYALVDCNSFFCSVEKAFHPGLEGRPVCVLSSNDGCIVALTPEAKALGLHRGDPIFKVRNVVNRHGVHVFSSNIQLYAAMSRRITSILRRSVRVVENYSIDESFLDLRGYGTPEQLVHQMQELRERIRLCTDIPVSIGIAPTKTLAKMGSKFAKQYAGYHGVCLIDTEARRRKALSLFDLADVWGIGRRTLGALQAMGIRTPLEFADRSEAWVRACFHKPGHQTWLELNGHPCIDTRELLRNKSITTSRSFGSMVGDAGQLRAAVASFVSSCANKLRAQCGACTTLTVYVSSNPFRSDLEQYANAASTSFVTPTADTILLTSAAMQCLAGIFRPGILYKKAGVLLGGIVDARTVQPDLFDPVPKRKERADLMHTIDNINHRYGAKTVSLAVEGTGPQPWHVKSEHRTPNYLTDIRELLTVKA